MLMGKDYAEYYREKIRSFKNDGDCLKAGIYLCEIAILQKYRGLREDAESTMRKIITCNTEYCEKQRDDESQAICGYLSGFKSIFQNELKAGLRILSNALARIQKTQDNLLISWTQCEIGYCYGGLGNYKKAIKEYEKGLEFAKEIDKEDEKFERFRTIASHNINIGKYYNNLGDHKSAQNYFEEGKEFAIASDDDELLGDIYGSLVSIYIRLGYRDKVNKTLNKAKEFAKKTNNLKVLALVHNNEADLYRGNKKYPRAIRLYEQALDYGKQAQNKKVIVDCLNNLGYTYLEKGDSDEAKRFYNRALQETEEKEKGEFPVLYEINKNLARILKEENKLKDALSCGEKAKEIAELIGDKKKIRNTESQITEIKSNIRVDKITDEVNLLCEDLKDQNKDLLKDIHNRRERRSLYFSKEDVHNLRGENFLLIAQKHNSFTPAVPTSKRKKSVGGGYFLMWHGKGIAIDPGFDFVTNIYDEGIAISHIDAVIITHSHPDHVNDFMTILTLLYEFNDLLPEEIEKKRIDVFLNTGASLRFAGWVDGNKYVRRCDMNKGISTGNQYGYDFKICPTEAHHNEYGDWESPLGLQIELDNGFKLGITGDTKWLDNLHTYYSGANLLIAHLGSLEEKELNINKKFKERLYKNHLGFIGCYQLIREAKPKLAIISEFGEELSNHRKDIAELYHNRLQGEGITCLPGDTNMKIQLPESADDKMRIRCCLREYNTDEHYDDYDSIHFWAESDQIRYCCDGCFRKSVR
jgi:tetratricopeptide (TPR) repeat protein